MHCLDGAQRRLRALLLLLGLSALLDALPAHAQSSCSVPNHEVPARPTGSAPSLLTPPTPVAAWPVSYSVLRLALQPPGGRSGPVEVRKEVLVGAAVGAASTFALAYVLQPMLTGRQSVGRPLLIAVPGGLAGAAGGWAYAVLRNRIASR